MSQITSYSSLSGLSVANSDVLPIVDVDDATQSITGTTKKIAVVDLATALAGLQPSGDTTGATDLANINALIGAGTPVYLNPAATYYINGPLTPLPSNFVFAGNHGGRGTTAPPAVIKGTASYTSTTAPITFVSGSSEQEVRDLSFDGTAMTAGTCAAIEAIAASPVNFVKLRRILVIGAGFTNGIHTNSAGGNQFGWTVEQVVVRSTNATGLLLIGNSDSDFIAVQAASCGTHGWSLQTCPNSRFIGCRANQNAQLGFSILGSGWGTGAGSGGANFIGCTTDRNVQSGMNISSTGTGPMVFSGCTFRRDGSDGVATRAGLLVAAGTTNPVIVDGIDIFTGVDDAGTGNNGPAIGISVSATAAPVVIGSGYVQGATSAIANGGNNPNFYVGPGVTQATGTTAAPTISTKSGTATLVAGTVVVNNAAVTATSNIQLTIQTPGGTPGFLRVSARTAGTSFTILSSSATDTSVVGWVIFGP